MRPNKNLTISFVILVTVCLLLSSCWKEDVTTITRIPQKQAASMLEVSSVQELAPQILKAAVIGNTYCVVYLRNSFKLDSAVSLNQFVSVLKHWGYVSYPVSLRDIPKKGDFIFYQPDYGAGVPSQGWVGIVIDANIVNRDEIQVRSICIGGRFLELLSLSKGDNLPVITSRNLLPSKVMVYRSTRS